MQSELFRAEEKKLQAQLEKDLRKFLSNMPRAVLRLETIINAFGVSIRADLPPEQRAPLFQFSKWCELHRFKILSQDQQFVMVALA